jgi:hypothetical protein
VRPVDRRIRDPCRGCRPDADVSDQPRPRLYPDPLRFDPERFLPGAPSRPDWAYPLFGGGTRKCIGAAFAMLEAVLVLAELGRRMLVGTALAATLLCATIAWPGVITQSDLDAKPSNALAAVGVALAAALTVTAVRRCGLGPHGIRGRGDRLALGLAAAFALAGCPGSSRTRASTSATSPG